jgi:threonine/homoserine/homoserine lactone efflux protein
VAHPPVYFLVGFFACLIGTIPFGPINLTVVKTTIDFDPKRGLEVAFAASIIEIVEACIAVFFGMLIGDFLATNLSVKLIIAFLFISLAVILLTQKPQPVLGEVAGTPPSFFKKGLLIAALNPQAIPFWVVALAAINQYFVFDYSGVYLFLFLAGVFAGKLTALYGFIVASSYLKAHLKRSSRLVNRLLAAVLLFIGITQGWHAVLILIAQSV